MAAMTRESSKQTRVNSIDTWMVLLIWEALREMLLIFYSGMTFQINGEKIKGIYLMTLERWAKNMDFDNDLSFLPSQTLVNFTLI